MGRRWAPEGSPRALSELHGLENYPGRASLFHSPGLSLFLKVYSNSSQSPPDLTSALRAKKGFRRAKVFPLHLQLPVSIFLLLQDRHGSFGHLEKWLTDSVAPPESLETRSLSGHRGWHNEPRVWNLLALPLR